MKMFIILIVWFTVAAADENILVINDIHFNPYANCQDHDKLPCASLQQLIENPINKWPDVFGKQKLNKRLSKEETNNAFLIGGLSTLAPIARSNKIKAVFLLGDLLRHNFDAEYKRNASAKYNNQEYLTNFSYKTILYVINQLHKKIPDAKIYMALGNNDTDRGDYVFPSQAFLSAISKNLSKYVANKSNFELTYTDGGYFSLPLNRNTILIGLNTNILNAYKPNIEIANKQLVWLTHQLAIANSTHKKVIIVQHVPFGIDMFKTSMSKVPVPVMYPLLEKQYLASLEQYKSILTTIFAAHYHAEYLSLVNTTPLIGGLAFNNLFGNLPGFKIVTINNNGSFAGYTTYIDYSHQNDMLHWKQLYNFNSAYGTPDQINTILQRFPSNLHNIKVINYIKYYNGNNPVFHQPISNPNNWKYYYCAVHYVSLIKYSNCLSNF